MVAILYCLLLCLAFLQLTGASFCGTGAIPFRFEVLPNGLPVLGCATPSCFGGDDSGRLSRQDSQFINGPGGIKDGFLREGDEERPRFRHPDAPPQRATCSPEASEENCAGVERWLGGLKQLKESTDALTLQCCSYDGLRFSAEIGRPIVNPGEVFSGGEVLRDGRQTAFDLISDVRKSVAQNGSVSYELVISRMNCIPDPDELVHDVGMRSNDINKIHDAGNSRHVLAGTTNCVQPDCEQQSQEQSQEQSDCEPPNCEKQAEEQSDCEPPNCEQKVQAQANCEPPNCEQKVQAQANCEPPKCAGHVQLQAYQGTFYAPEIVAVPQVVVPAQAPSCFPGDAEVYTPTGKKTIEQLRIGDLVLSADRNRTSYIPVVSFLHRLPHKAVDYQRIETEDGAVLKLTALHFIYKVPCNDRRSTRNLVYAKDIGVGDCVYRLTSNGEGLMPTRVANVTVVSGVGAFAPMTSNSDVIVDGMLASCHNIVRSQSLQQTFFQSIGVIEQLARWAFGGSAHDSQSFDIVDLPPGVDFLLSVMGYIIPQSLFSH